MRAPFKATTAIHNDAEHSAALSRIDELWGSREGSLEAQELEVLAILVDDYENKHHEIEPPDPIEAIKFRIEQMGLTPSEAAELFGARSRMSEVFNGKRALSIEMIRAIHAKLHIPAEILIQPVKRKAS